MPLSTLTVALGLVGSLLASLTLRPSQFVILLVVGAFLGAFAALLARSVAENRALDSREAVAEAGRSAVLGAVWAVAAGVLLDSLGSYGWPAVVAFVLVYPAVRALSGPATRPGPARAVAGPGIAPRRRLSMPPLERCSTAELAASWDASYDLLQGTSSPLVKARIVALRGAYLDELERRDRSGVRRWLWSGAGPGSAARRYRRKTGEDGEAKPELA